jgi:hypothetical protein
MTTLPTTLTATLTTTLATTLRMTMTGSDKQTTPRSTSPSRVVATLAALALTAGLAACAPEPGVMPTGKQPEGTRTEPSWPESGDEQSAQKQVTLPDTFPNDRLSFGDAVIDDAGERGEGTWFVVFRVDSLAAASALLDKIAMDDALVVVDDVEAGDGGRSVTLSAEGLQISALTLTEGTGALLSLDVSGTQL